MSTEEGFLIAIIYPCIEYSEARSRAGIPTVSNYNQTVCDETFNSILHDEKNRFHRLLPAANKQTYSLRRNRRFNIKKWKTDRFRNTFLMTLFLGNNVT